MRTLLIKVLNSDKKEIFNKIFGIQALYRVKAKLVSQQNEFNQTYLQ